MKKNLLMLFMLMSFALTVFAQVPTVMMYQVQVKHGKAAAQNVSIEMQLRKSQNGAAEWSQTFNLTNVKNGSVQNLGLDFGNKINWSDGEYWLATIIDGVEMGSAKLTSVPYSLVAKTTEGTIDAKSLIGKWKCVDPKSTTYEAEFKEDGTFSCKITDNYYNESSSGTYKILANGIVYTNAPNSDDVHLCDGIVKIDDKHIMAITDDGRFGKMIYYTKQ